MSVLVYVLLLGAVIPPAAARTLGAPPQDPRYVPQSKFLCTDGTSIPWSRVNDEYCDCGDDEPGTAACPDSRFYCVNQGAIPKQLWSSAVRDGACDCCDGSDELPGVCASTCYEEGAAVREALQRQIDEAKVALQTKQQWISKAAGERSASEHKIVQLKSELEVHKKSLEQLKEEKEKHEKEEEEQKAVLRTKEETENAKKSAEEDAKKIAEDKAAEDVTPDKAAAVEEEEEELNANERQALALENHCYSKVRLYGNQDFTGWQAKYGRGAYEGIKFLANGAEDNGASSMKVPPGCIAYVYENPDFTGKRGVFATGEYTAGEMGAEGMEDKSISSMRVLNDDDPDPDPDHLDQDGAVEETTGQPQLEALDCIKWRQTKGCNPNGDREPEYDKLCSVSIPTGASGYCECAGDIRRNKVPCVHATFDCAQACSGKVLPDLPPPPPPPVVTSANFKLPAAEAARTKFNAGQAKVSEVERTVKDLEGTLSAQYGADGEFLELKGQCFDLRKQQYVYKVCPFSNVKQDHTGLGNWGEWIDGYTTMHFTGGGSCWQGPSRSAKVHLGCGRENKILTVDEPERCTYVLDMSTPAACTTEQLGRLEAQLKELSGPEALKDEM
eukprot:TRINITY_DN7786_c0_g1_i3.p1 TRINITY_DN7786_c0_g1~~TRINITY_DN7786_c0_g1_i3.p1  ORF type:complete len:614 (+),score=180.59 TRINITY_DN7786_c0_g1_i3:196-2037(+)